MDPFEPSAVDPTRLFIGLGALVALLSLPYWWRFYKDLGKVSFKGGVPSFENLRLAVLGTCGAIFLGCGGYLAGALRVFS